MKIGILCVIFTVVYSRTMVLKFVRHYRAQELRENLLKICVVYLELCSGRYFMRFSFIVFAL